MLVHVFPGVLRIIYDRIDERLKCYLRSVVMKSHVTIWIVHVVSRIKVP